MRYTIAIIASFILLSTTSCMKTYTCECKVESYNSNGDVEKSSYTDDIKSISKKDARSVCDLDDENTVTAHNPRGTVRTCELK